MSTQQANSSEDPWMAQTTGKYRNNRWKDLSMDFVVGLLESEGYNAIWVVVDRLSKMKHLVPCWDDTDGKKLGEMFIREVFKLRGATRTP